VQNGAHRAAQKSSEIQGFPSIPIKTH